MKHIFDVDIATEYGINAAILFENICYWVKQNEANETNFFDGDYWTYNSKKAFSELFPYLSERQVRTGLDKLIESGLIKTGNYNKLAYDRTLWYALTQKGKSIGLFGRMDCIKKANGTVQNVAPIPNINPDITQSDNKPVKKKERKPSGYDEILSAVSDEELKSLYYEYIKMRKLIKSPMTDRALTMLVSKVNELEPYDIGRQKKMLETAIMNNWKSVYPLKEDKPIQQTAPTGTGNQFYDLIAGGAFE